MVLPVYHAVPVVDILLIDTRDRAQLQTHIVIGMAAFFRCGQKVNGQSLLLRHQGSIVRISFPKTFFRVSNRINTMTFIF